jgi:hypothetical protein
MSNESLLIRMRLKRDFVSKAGYMPHNFTFITRTERIPFSDFEQIDLHSDGVSQEQSDFRANRMVVYSNPKIKALIRILQMSTLNWRLA